MTTTESLTVLAIIIAPFLAVFSQRKIDVIRERRNQKLWIFRTLMATRANRLAIEHVQALNSIDLFFAKKGKENKVVEKWGEYLDHLATVPKEDDPEYKIKMESWNSSKDNHLAELLSIMGEALGYHFDKVKIKKGIYFPKGHGEAELDNLLIRKGMVNIITGKWGFPVQDFKSIPRNK